VTDLHLRILRLVAKQRQRELDDHDATDHNRGSASAARRRDLDHAAGRTSANVAAAEARRRYRPRRGGVRASTSGIEAA
jgi:hypothetical protein